MLFWLVKNFRQVQVDPEAIDDELGVYVLLLNVHALKFRDHKLQHTYVADFGLNDVLWIYPFWIPEFPNHISTRFAVLAVLDWFEIHREINLLLFVLDIKVRLESFDVHRTSQGL